MLKNEKNSLIYFSLLLIFCAGIGAFFYFQLFRDEMLEVVKPNEIQNTDSSVCNRSETYPLTPEFMRAISIVKQKFHFYDSPGFLDEFENCLNIQYADLSTTKAEGVFYFDDSISSSNNLVISVDNKYRQKDDYMTAILIVHEITHARQFYKNSSKSCIDLELEAFWNEFLLFTTFNEGERKALMARMYNPLDYPSSDPSVRAFADMVDVVAAQAKNCPEGDGACLQKYEVSALREYLLGSKFYQEQCKNETYSREGS